MGLLWKIIGNKYGMLVLGILAVGAGFYQLNKVEVTCGSDVMQQGDTCETTRKGRTTVNTYDEAKDNQALTGKILTGVGGALTLGGAGWIVVGIVRRKPEGTAPEETVPEPAVAA